MSLMTMTDTPAASLVERPRYRRRQYLIDPPLQGRFFLTMLLISGAVIFGVVLLAAHYFLAVVPAGESLSQPQIRAELLRVALMASLLAVLAAPAVSLVLSHRIAGPAWRLRKGFKAIGEGRLEAEIHLRDKDYLKTTAEAYNAMLAQLREREMGEALRRETARENIRRAAADLAQGDELAIPEVLRLLEETEQQLR